MMTSSTGGKEGDTAGIALVELEAIVLIPPGPQKRHTKGPQA